jgi:hypothetical protein
MMKGASGRWSVASMSKDYNGVSLSLPTSSTVESLFCNAVFLVFIAISGCCFYFRVFSNSVRHRDAVVLIHCILNGCPFFKCIWTWRNARSFDSFVRPSVSLYTWSSFWTSEQKFMESDVKNFLLNCVQRLQFLFTSVNVNVTLRAALPALL